MRTSTIILVAAAIGSAMAQSVEEVCTVSALLPCLEVPLSTSCADFACACSAVGYQTNCYKSLCGTTPIPTDVLAAYTDACQGGSGGFATLPTTLPAAASSTAAAAPTTPAATAPAVTPTAATATGQAATATGQAGATTTSHAGASAGLVPVGGLLAAMLGVLAYM